MLASVQPYADLSLGASASPLSAPAREAWLHGRLSFDATRKLLTESPIGPGAFLVREQDAEEGTYTLCVLTSGSIAHHHIQRTAKGKFTVDGKPCKDASSLGQVIGSLSAPLGLRGGVPCDYQPYFDVSP